MAALREASVFSEVPEVLIFDGDSGGDLLGFAEFAKVWAKKVEELALQKAKEGVFIRGFKLVKRRLMRKFSGASPTEIALSLEKVSTVPHEFFLVQDVVTPAQAEKIATRHLKSLGLKPAQVRPYVDKIGLEATPGLSDELVLAPVHDARDGVNPKEVYHLESIQPMPQIPK